MKKILLLGDSIRLGYDGYAKEAFKGIAEIYAPKENCAFSQYMLRWVHEWKRREGYPDDIDLVHWNASAWDVLRIMGDDTFTSLENYKENLQRLEKRLRVLFPNAKQVFATGTSVIEEGYEPPYQRYNADIEKFNQIAIETLAPLGVHINDLYAITKAAPPSCRSDMTHFYTVDGIKLIGGQVVKTLCRVLEIDCNKLNDVNASLPTISKELMGV